MASTLGTQSSSAVTAATVAPSAGIVKERVISSCSENGAPANVSTISAQNVIESRQRFTGSPSLHLGSTPNSSAAPSFPTPGTNVSRLRGGNPGPNSKGVRAPKNSGSDQGPPGVTVTEISSTPGGPSNYAILVPASVQFRGKEVMQMDLKIDQTTLAAAESLSRQVREKFVTKTITSSSAGMGPKVNGNGPGGGDSQVSSSGSQGPSPSGISAEWLGSAPSIPGKNGINHRPNFNSGVSFGVSQDAGGSIVFTAAQPTNNHGSNYNFSPASPHASSKWTTVVGGKQSPASSSSSSAEEPPLAVSQNMLRKTGGRNPRDLLAEKLKKAGSGGPVSSSGLIGMRAPVGTTRKGPGGNIVISNRKSRAGPNGGVKVVQVNGNSAVTTTALPTLQSFSFSQPTSPGTFSVSPNQNLRVSEIPGIEKSASLTSFHREFLSSPSGTVAQTPPSEQTQGALPHFSSIPSAILPTNGSSSHQFNSATTMSSSLPPVSSLQNGPQHSTINSLRIPSQQPFVDSGFPDSGPIEVEISGISAPSPLGSSGNRDDLSDLDELLKYSSPTTSAALNPFKDSFGSSSSLNQLDALDSPTPMSKAQEKSPGFPPLCPQPVSQSNLTSGLSSKGKLLSPRSSDGSTGVPSQSTQKTEAAAAAAAKIAAAAASGKSTAGGGASKKERKAKGPAPFCEFGGAPPENKACRQRAIVGFSFCIRHILRDPKAPYRVCAYVRKQGSKDIPCSNAVHVDKPTEYCTTHLIALGVVEPKRKPGSTQNQKKKDDIKSAEDSNAEDIEATIGMGRVPSIGNPACDSIQHSEMSPEGDRISSNGKNCQQPGGVQNEGGAGISQTWPQSPYPNSSHPQQSPGKGVPGGMFQGGVQHPPPPPSFVAGYQPDPSQVNGAVTPSPSHQRIPHPSSIAIPQSQNSQQPQHYGQQCDPPLNGGTPSFAPNGGVPYDPHSHPPQISQPNRFPSESYPSQHPMMLSHPQRSLSQTVPPLNGNYSEGSPAIPGNRIVNSQQQPMNCVGSRVGSGGGVMVGFGNGRLSSQSSINSFPSPIPSNGNNNQQVQMSPFPPPSPIGSATSGPGGFIYPMSSSADGCRPGSRPMSGSGASSSTPRPASNLSTQGSSSVVPSPSPWKPKTPVSSSDLVRTHPELASKLIGSSSLSENYCLPHEPPGYPSTAVPTSAGLSSDADNSASRTVRPHPLNASLDDSSQGPFLIQGNPYLDSTLTATQSANGPGAPQIVRQNGLPLVHEPPSTPTASQIQSQNPTIGQNLSENPPDQNAMDANPDRPPSHHPIMGPRTNLTQLMFPSPVPSDQSGESQLSCATNFGGNGSTSCFSPLGSSSGQGGFGSTNLLPPLFPPPPAPQNSHQQPTGFASQQPQQQQQQQPITAQGCVTAYPNPNSGPAWQHPPVMTVQTAASIGGSVQVRGPIDPNGQIMMTPHGMMQTASLLLDGRQCIPTQGGQFITRDSKTIFTVPQTTTTASANGKKVIRLEQKKRRAKMAGKYYRRIPPVEIMCRMVEDYDFDRLDLFPLGLEPSSSDTEGEDDSQCITDSDKCFVSRLLGSFEENIDDGADVLAELEDLDEIFPDGELTEGGEDAISFGSRMTGKHELYLLKKQLRLERGRLRKSWQEGAVIVGTSKTFPNAAGKALCDRYKKIKIKARKVPLPNDPSASTPTTPVSTTKWKSSRKVVDRVDLTRACYHRNSEGQRCSAPCLPYSNHCLRHILYNVDQRLYRYCSEPGCQSPVLDLGMEASLPAGPLCPTHSSRRKYLDRLKGGEDGEDGLATPTSTDLTPGGRKRKQPKQYNFLRKRKRRRTAKPTATGGPHNSSTGTHDNDSTRTSTPNDPPEDEDDEDERASTLSPSSTSDHASDSESVSGQDRSTVNTRMGVDADVGDVVSLASVAEDLGFADHERDFLDDILNKLPEEAFNSIMTQDDFARNGEQLIRVEETSAVLDAIAIGVTVSNGPAGSVTDVATIPPPNGGPPDMIPVTEGNHSWADVESFLLSEGYRGSSFGDGPNHVPHSASFPGNGIASSSVRQLPGHMAPTGVSGSFVPPLPPPLPPPYPSSANPSPAASSPAQS